jgi:site-specific recombinase XerD
MRKKKKIYPNQSDLVFSHLDGSPIKSIRNSWKAICKITGFSYLHFHDLRHIFCSNLILSGADLKEVKEMSGHSNIAMTDRYSHLTSEHKLHRQKRLAEYYAQNDASQVG